MPAMDESFLHFVRAVRRRMGIVRAIEGMGIGALAGSILGLGLMGALILRSDASLLPGALMVGLGAIAGLIWGAARQPGAMAAAAQADRQLHLQDLLTTALAARGSPDPWAQAVVAMAGHRCGTLHPRQVILSRLGARAWGGIVTTAVLAIAVAALAPQAAPTLANENGRSFVSARDIKQMTQPPPRLAGPQPADPGPQTSPADRPSALPMADDSANSHTPDPSVESPHAADIINPDGAGGGEGRSDTSIDPDRLALTSTDASTASEDGTLTGGAGREGANGEGSVAGTQASSAPADHAPPWKSDGWRATRGAALDALERNEVPADFRDLVREYFGRE